MQDVLCCWDFLLSTDLEYVDSFFISMLLEQRVSILNGDAGHILTILMRYDKINVYQPDINDCLKVSTN